MRVRILTVTVGLAIGFSVVAGGGVAAADDSTVTFALQGGTLDITVPATASLSSGTQSQTGTVIAGSLGSTTVEDSRGVNNGGWTVTAQSSDFVLPDNSNPIPAAGLSYATDPLAITTSGTVTVQPSDETDLSQAIAVVGATAATGANAATWDPTLTLTVPSSAPAGNYTATLTQSVS